MNKVNLEISLGDARDVYMVMEKRLRELVADKEFFLKHGNELVVQGLEREIKWMKELQKKFDV